MSLYIIYGTNTGILTKMIILKKNKSETFILQKFDNPITSIIFLSGNEIGVLLSSALIILYDYMAQ